MIWMKSAWIGLSTFSLYSIAIAPACHADETPRTTLEAAIKAHGGEENLTKTLTATLLAKAKMSLPPDVEASISWEETFELPRRYRRSIKGQMMGKDFTMEYAITDGKGWTRENGGEPKEFKGEKPQLERGWNAVLATLPSCLSDGVKLRPGGKDKVDGKEALGVVISGEAIGGEMILFFDSKSRLLLKSRRRMQHPLSGQDADGELQFGEYKRVSGVEYPHRITSYIGGKKVVEMEITRIELLKKVEDRLFERP